MVSSCCPVAHGMMALALKASPCSYSRSNFPNANASFQFNRIRFPKARSLAVPTAAKINPCLDSSSPSLASGIFGSRAPIDHFSSRRSVRTTRGPDAPRARTDDVPLSFRYPPMKTKPGFWWRILAFIPYFMPFHECWLYSENSYNVIPFFEEFELKTYHFFLALGTLPRWFLMGYFFGCYLGIVRRKEWPHFLRFHVITGMLLEISLQVIGTITDWTPAGIYWGKFGTHLWTAVTFAYFFTVLKCAACALQGTYADVPFMSKAAYIQLPYD